MVSLLGLNPDIGDSGVLNRICHLPRDGVAGTCQDVAVCLIDHILCENVSGDAAPERELLVELVAADLCEIVSSGIEEHRVDQALCAVDRERFAGTDLLVELEQALLIGVGGILREGSAELRLIAELVEDLLVGADAEGTDQDGDRNLSGAVHADVEHVICIRLVLQPCTAVGDDGAGVERLAVLVVIDAVVDARGTDQLGDNDTLCAVDDERAGLGHERQISHEDLLLLDFLLVLLVVQSYLYLEGRGVGRVSLLALGNGILVLIHPVQIQLVADERKGQMAAVVLDRGDIVEDLLESVFQEPVVGSLLNVIQIGHLQNFVLARIAHAHRFAVSGRMQPDVTHSFHLVLLWYN